MEKKGKPYAVIISPAQYEAYQDAAKEKLFKVIDEIQTSNAGVNGKEVFKTVTEEVEKVRQEMYDSR